MSDRRRRRTDRRSEDRGAPRRRWSDDGAHAVAEAFSAILAGDAAAEALGAEVRAAGRAANMERILAEMRSRAQVHAPE